ncbi:unnamed protein product [Lactuca saligna]|uniref:DNA polymerase alpha subunit B n=1 Tax=Lactuca saligna TaxID=75948 RepID=A0AA35YB92_LACSI|nr:unnamed protein product [Lactuca saligna]
MDGFISASSYSAKKTTMVLFINVDCSPVSSLSANKASCVNTSTSGSQKIPVNKMVRTDSQDPSKRMHAYFQAKPQLLMLLGPFIDSEHPEIKKGALNRTYDDLFCLEILRRLQDYVEYMGSAARVILVPSICDAHHDYVFP